MEKWTTATQQDVNEYKGITLNEWTLSQNYAYSTIDSDILEKANL